MLNQIPIIFVLFISAILFSCDGGPKLNVTRSPGDTSTTLTASIDDGKIYYQTNCGGCHSAGNDDPVAVFSASDLSVSTHISNDVSKYGGATSFLMKRFTKIPEQRVIDLRAYLNSINP